MSEICIHIGTHKTGTTHIQNTLHANRRLLRKNGLFYPDIGRATGQHVLTTRWITSLPAVYQARRDVLANWSKIEPKDGIVFLSSEEFSRAAPDRVNWAELKTLLSRFERIRILCVLRNPVDFLQSTYLEVIKSRNLIPVPQFVTQTLDPSHQDRLYFDPNPLLDQLLLDFPCADLKFIAYEQARANSGGLLGAIFTHLGVDCEVSELTAADPALANVSHSPLVAWAAHQVSMPASASNRLLDITAGVMRDLFGERKTSLFSRTERALLREEFATKLDRFDARVQAFDPDFRSDPLPGDDLLCRGELGAPFWVNQSRAIHAACGKAA